MKIHQNKNSYLIVVFILSIVIPIGFLRHSQRKIQEVYDAGIFASQGFYFRGTCLTGAEWQNE